MKAVILAGGLGTRLSEETHLKPKPMVEIGGKPILWHIMKYYSSYGVNDFIICCGYKGYVIKEYFSNYFNHMSDIKISLNDNKIDYLENKSENWNVTLIDTGDNTMTGGRLKRVKKYLKNEKMFCFTYGDGLSNIDISKLISFHENHGQIATISVVTPPGRFGAVELNGTRVNSFIEKPKGDGGQINGGFFVLSPDAIDYINDDSTSWENEPLSNLAKDNKLYAYSHSGFWHPMDTLRDRNLLESLWSSNKAPWKNW